MAERSSLISLDGFIHKYFDKKQIDDDEYHRYRVIAQDCLKELHLHHMPVVKTTELTVNSTTKTASFPDDMLDYVGLFTEIDGRWFPITRDDEIVDGTLTNVTAEEVGNFEYAQGFAQPGYNYYFYTPDYENRRFIFNGVDTITVVLKYKSSGVDVVAYGSASDVQIPIEAEDTLENYIVWQVSKYDEEPESKIARKKRDYEDSLVFLRRIGDYSIQELRDIMFSTMRQTTNR